MLVTDFVRILSTSYAPAGHAIDREGSSLHEFKRNAECIADGGSEKQRAGGVKLGL